MKKIILVLFSAALPLLALEGVGWMWEKSLSSGPYAWELVASRRMSWIPYERPGGGYTLIEPHSSYEWLGVEVDINSHGLRDEETSYDKPAGVKRILNLGDSVAMGWAVEQEHTYGDRLEGSLSAAGESRWEVINAAVPGWTLDNALEFYLDKGKQYDPDLVILEVTLVNDIFGQNALLENQRPPVIEWLRANTYFWPFLATQVREAQAKAKGEKAPSVLDAPTDAAAYFPEDCDHEAYGRVGNAIASVHREATGQGAGFLLVLFPLELQVTDPDMSRAAQSCLMAKAEQAGIPALDLTSTYEQACREKSPQPCQNGDKHLFADVWMHPSAKGHELAAEAIAEHIRAN